MQRRFPGSQVDLVVLTVAPVGGDAGTDLTQFNSSGAKPDEWDLRLDLAGAGTADFFLYVRDASGWALASDTGNLGQLGGQTLTCSNAFVFRVDGLAGYSAACLLKVVKTGIATVNAAKVTPILRAMEG